jgi:hypothetical protein
MNSSMSKAPFSPNTLVEELVWLATQLGCVGHMLDNNYYMMTSKYKFALDIIMTRAQTRHEIGGLSFLPRFCGIFCKGWDYFQ